MGVHESKNQTTKDLERYITYLRNTKIDYLQPKNKPLDSGKCQLGPLKWRSLMIQKLKEMKEKSQWESYTFTLLQYFKDTKIDRYARSLSFQSWLDFSNTFDFNSTKNVRKSVKKACCPISLDSFQQIQRYRPSANINLQSGQDASLKVKKLFLYLHKEISSEDHLINDAIVQFADIFTKKYSIMIAHNMNQEESMAILKNAMEDVKILFKLLEDLLDDFYSKFITESVKINKPEKRRQLMHSIVLKAVFSKNNNIYGMLFSFFSKAYKAKELRFAYILETFKDIEPAQLDLKPIFRLEDDKEAYKCLIDTLRRIEAEFSPVDKFELVGKLKSEMEECIDNYWNKRDPNLTRQELEIDIDSMITIFIYCIIQTQSCKLLTSLYYLEEFLSEQMKTVQGQESALYTTFTCALKYLEDLEDKEVNDILAKGKNFLIEG